MTMRPLVIGPEVQKAANELVSFASKRENWFDPRIHKWTPGDRSEYTIAFNTYRCCFTYTVGKNESVHRMLSISVPGKDYPNIIAVWTIAEMMGFTGGKKVNDTMMDRATDWVVYIEQATHAVVVAQQIHDLKP